MDIQYTGPGAQTQTLYSTFSFFGKMVNALGHRELSPAPCPYRESRNISPLNYCYHTTFLSRGNPATAGNEIRPRLFSFRSKLEFT